LCDIVGEHAGFAMAKPSDPPALPDDVARLAATQVAAGRFASVEDVVRVSVENLVADAEEAETTLDAAWEGYRKRAPADPRDMTATEVAAAMHSGGDPERLKAFRAHVDALCDDLRNGLGTSDSPDELMARIDEELGFPQP
jgi:Arc/MetJ-type ribon-helix-helix transcriptional regulator